MVDCERRKEFNILECAENLNVHEASLILLLKNELLVYILSNAIGYTYVGVFIGA